VRPGEAARFDRLSSPIYPTLSHPEHFEESSVGLVGHGHGRRSLDDPQAEGLGAGRGFGFAQLRDVGIEAYHQQGIHLLHTACDLVEESMTRLGGKARHLGESLCMYLPSAQAGCRGRKSGEGCTYIR